MTQDQQLTDHEQQCAAAHHHLVKGAKDLVEKMKTPAALLLFCTDALNWMHMYLRDKKITNREDDHCYSLIVIIENITIPWFAGGPDMIDNIANGIKEVHGYCGDDGLRHLNNSIIVGFGHYSEGMDWTSGGMGELLTSISSLVDLLGAMEQYELAINPREQQGEPDSGGIKKWLLSVGATLTPAALQIEQLKAEDEALKAENAKLKKKPGKLVKKQDLAIAS